MRQDCVARSERGSRALKRGLRMAKQAFTSKLRFSEGDARVYISTISGAIVLTATADCVYNLAAIVLGVLFFVLHQ